MKTEMKTALMIAALMTCALARAGSVTMITDLEADTAKSVTGPAQSNAIAQAAAHLLRTDNPHGVNAAQIGALSLTDWTDGTNALARTPVERLYAEGSYNLCWWTASASNALTRHTVETTYGVLSYSPDFGVTWSEERPALTNVTVSIFDGNMIDLGNHWYYQWSGYGGTVIWNNPDLLQSVDFTGQSFFGTYQPETSFGTGRAYISQPTNSTVYTLPTSAQASTWNAKVDSTNGTLHNATATGTFTLNGSPLGLGMTTNDVDARVRLLAPTNSPTFTGAITWNGNTQSSWPISVSASTVTQIVASAAVTNRLWYSQPWIGDALTLGVYKDNSSMTAGATSTALIVWSRIPVDVSAPLTVRYAIQNSTAAPFATSNIVALVPHQTSTLADAVRIVGGGYNGASGERTYSVTYRPQADDSAARAIKVFVVNVGAVSGSTRAFSDMRWSPATADEILAAGL